MTFRGRLRLVALFGALAAAALCAMLPRSELVAAPLGVLLVALALRDRLQTREPLLRNYPVVGHLHGLLHQAGKLLGLHQPLAPYTWAQVDLIRARAAGRSEYAAFGAQLDGPRVELLHALSPAKPEDVPDRVVVGASCAQPYSASYLNISAMAYGAISDPAIRALAGGAKRGGFALGTGEAGVPPVFLEHGADLIWQLGAAYFGARAKDGSFDLGAFRERAARPEIKMIEIKLSQGAKPGRGGILPAEKATPEVAAACGIPVGQACLVPATHSAFSSPRELCEWIALLREASGGKPVGLKLCVGRLADLLALVRGALATGCAPDFLAVDGAEGGTGAAPVELQSFVGAPLARALPLVRDALVGAGLRERVRVIASGKLTTGADLVAALARGADLCASARPFLIAMGCIQALICASNECPTGIATQDRRLTRGLAAEAMAHNVARYHAQTLAAFRELVAVTGCSSAAALGAAHLAPGEPAPALRPGQLVDGEALPAPWAEAWQLARADRF